jgi:multicomponent Na+:H+ antiporter subunit G
MNEILLVPGLIFLATGTLGIIRLEGTLNRMHASSKASTLGVGFVILAGATEFYPDGAWLTAVLALVFMFMTAPTGAHMIARAREESS